jgi:hypothetical protein
VLQAREGELRAKLLSGECGLAGDYHKATIRTHPLMRVDMPALKAHLGEALKPFMTERKMTQIWLSWAPRL